MMIMSALFSTNTLAWIFIVLADYNNSPRLDMMMSLHSDTLYWLLDNQSLLFLLSAACLAEEQYIPGCIVFGITQCLWEGGSVDTSVLGPESQEGTHESRKSPIALAIDVLFWIFLFFFFLSPFGGGGYFQLNSSILREVLACPRGPKAVLFRLSKFQKILPDQGSNPLSTAREASTPTDAVSL